MMKPKQTVKPEILKRFYESLTDLIYDYLCYFRTDKTTLPSTEVVHVIRNCSMEYVKHILEMAIKLNAEDKTNHEKQKCSTCSHEIMTPGYCDYCATSITL